MRYGPGSFTPGELERLQRERLERERIEQLMHLGNALLGSARQRPAGLVDPQGLASPATNANAGYPQRGGVAYDGQPTGNTSALPFRQDNRNPDGTWTAPDATRDNIRGTSVDPEGPVWPRWKQAPPPHGEGEFVSGEPFFDIDEITQKAEFYPPGRPLIDRNVDGNPASRQRVNDTDSGTFWRRRLLVGQRDESPYAPPGQERPHGEDVKEFMSSLGLAGPPRGLGGQPDRSKTAQPQLMGDANHPTGMLSPGTFAQADPVLRPDQSRPPDAKGTQSAAISIKPFDIPSRTDGRIIARRYELDVPSEKGGVIIQEVYDVRGKMYFRGKGNQDVIERRTPYTEILGEIPAGGKSTGKFKDDDYMRRPGERITIQADINGRGKVYFLEGKTVEQLKKEGFNNPSSRTGLPTGDKLSKPGRYDAPAGTPELPIDFNIKW